MNRAWMYNANRMEAYFHGELDKFIKVKENHARKENTVLILCLCRVCGNLKVFSEPTTIRSPVHIIYYCTYKLLILLCTAWPGEIRRPVPRETTSKCSRGFVSFHSARSGQCGRQIFWRNFRISNERWIPFTSWNSGTVKRPRGMMEKHV